MVLIVIVLFIAGLFFSPAWLLLAGYLIYFFASMDSRRDKAVESRVRRMISSGMEYADFRDLYYDAAKSYAIAKGGGRLRTAMLQLQPLCLSTIVRISSFL